MDNRTCKNTDGCQRVRLYGSLAYYTKGFTLEEATGLAIKGDLDVHFVYVTAVLLFSLLNQVSHPKEFWKYQKSGKLILWPRVLFGFLLGFSLPPFTLWNTWKMEKLGCNLQLLSLLML